MNRAKKAGGLYVETTIPSYATARDSRDIIKLNKQIVTRAFWKNERHKFNLFTSESVFAECRRGDGEAAVKRIEFLDGIEMLPETAEIENLAKLYQKFLGIPDRAEIDCTHLALCVFHQIDYLLSWNCTHLGPVAQRKAKEYNDKRGLWTPLLVTPETIAEYLQGAL